jgi:riboflavin synthase
MFTGIITDLGTIQSLESNNQDIRIKVMVSKLDMQDVSIGDSIATNGVCLTVVEFDSNSFSADVSPETISRTSFHDYKVGDQVNLEKALLVSDRLGGHIVSGHVDGLGKIISMIQQGRWMDVWIEPERIHNSRWSESNGK